MTTTPAIVVIGASEGGLDALHLLAAALPADLAAAVFVVLHIGAHKSQLPMLLNRWGPLRAIHPQDGDPIHAGQIYIAPPDHHLVIESGCVRLTRGPRENWVRPAIDPLFRSAARSYGSAVIGVILTGGLNDGTAGLYEIKQCDGITVVQDPDGAVNPSMPRSALKHVAVDHCVPLPGIPMLLAKLVAERNADAFVEPTQQRSAMTRGQEMIAEYKHDRPVAVTCPDCGGALLRAELGTLTQFRCHIGHVYTAEVMVASQFAAMEWSLEAALRSLSERCEMCRQMADKAKGAGDAPAALEWDLAMQEAEKRSTALREILTEGWTHPCDIAD